MGGVEKRKLVATEKFKCLSENARRRKQHAIRRVRNVMETEQRERIGEKNGVFSRI